VRTKCVEKTCVGLWGYSWGPRELPGIGEPGLREVWVAAIGIRADSRGFMGACDRSCAGMVCMVGVGPKWSHSMAHVLALDSRTWTREDVPGLGLIDKAVDLLRGCM
jgi:hypothetical protein